MDNIEMAKLKVAELKRELKIRNLNTIGKRTELLERLQAAVAGGVVASSGVGVVDEDDDQYDEDEILAGEDDDSTMTPLEEAAALAAAEKAIATPARGRRAVVAATAATPATPKTPARKVAIRRTATPATPAATAAATPKVAVTTPVAATKAATPAKPSPQKKLPTPAKKQPAPVTEKDEESDEPQKKVLKLSAADKENSESDAVADAAPVVEKTAAELRADRFGIKSESVQKKKRTERFGEVNGTKSEKLSMEVGTVNVEKMKSRASRFGETTAKTLTKVETDEKKKARMERFGDADADKKDVTSDSVLAARAAKFSSTASAAARVSTEPIVSASGKQLITASDTDDQIMKVKRSARFGA